MRFICDMGISLKVNEWLNKNNYESIHLRDKGLQSVSDSEIVNLALKEKLIILTMDLDFGYLLSISKLNLPSTIIFRLSDESSENVITKLIELLPKCNKYLENGCIISVNDKKYRIRELPF